MNEPKRRGRQPKAQPPVVREGDSEQQAYARRVWSGQSISLPEGERRWRVSKALQEQGWSMEGVELP